MSSHLATPTPEQILGGLVFLNLVVHVLRVVEPRQSVIGDFACEAAVHHAVGRFKPETRVYRE